MPRRSLPNNIKSHGKQARAEGVTKFKSWSEVELNPASEGAKPQFFALGILLEEKFPITPEGLAANIPPGVDMSDARRAVDDSEPWQHLFRALHRLQTPDRRGLSRISPFVHCDGSVLRNVAGITGGAWQMILGLIAAIWASRSLNDKQPPGGVSGDKNDLENPEASGSENSANLPASPDANSHTISDAGSPAPSDNVVPSAEGDTGPHQSKLRRGTRTRLPPAVFGKTVKMPQNPEPVKARRSFSTRSETTVVNVAAALMVMINQTRVDDEPFQNLRWTADNIRIEDDYKTILDGALIKGDEDCIVAAVEAKRGTRDVEGIPVLRQEGLEIVACLKRRPAPFRTLPFLLFSQYGDELYVSITTPTATYLKFLEMEDHCLKDLKKDYLRVTRFGPYIVWDHEDLKNLVIILLAFRLNIAKVAVSFAKKSKRWRKKDEVWPSEEGHYG